MDQKNCKKIVFTSLVLTSLGSHALSASVPPLSSAQIIQAIKTNSKDELKRLTTENPTLVTTIDPGTKQTPLQYAAEQKDDADFIRILFAAGATDVDGIAMKLATKRNKRVQKNQSVLDLLHKGRMPAQEPLVGSNVSSSSTLEPKVPSSEELVSVIAQPKKEVVVPQNFIALIRLVNKPSASEDEIASNLKKLTTALKQDPNLINKQDSYGNTLLSFASRNGLFKIVKELVEVHKADINLADSKKSTPLQWAIVNGHNDIITYLIHHGGLIYAKIDIKLESSALDKLLSQPFKKLYTGDTQNLKELIAPLLDNELHLSVAYLTHPLKYSDDAELYEKSAKQIFDTLIQTLQSKNPKENLIKITNSFAYTSLALLGNFIAVTFAVPKQYDNITKDIYNSVKAVLPNIAHTYPEEKAPHISFAKGVKNSSGKIADLSNLKLPKSFVNTLERNAKSLFSQAGESIKLIVSMRLPTRDKTNYRDFSQAL